MRRIPLIVLAFLFVPSTPVFAAGIATGFDAMQSTVMQEGQSSFSGLAARVRLQHPQLVKQVEILPTIEYWRNSNTLQPYGIHATRRDATLGCDARFNFATQKWRPYLGAGFGIHFLSSQVDAPSFGINDASDGVVKGGFTGLAGLSFGMTEKIDNFLELKYHHVSDYRQLKISWGLAFNL